MTGRCRFRVPRFTALALLATSATAIAQTRELTPPTPMKVAAIAIACTHCGTRWEAPPVANPREPGDHGTLAGRRPTPDARPLRGFDPFRDLDFRDHQPLVHRLRRIQAVAFVTVWDSTSATLYVGVNRDGEPGLHLRQKKHDRGTLAPASRTLFSEVTPWRAIRLASQSRQWRAP
jgi:hypothetical protein